MGWRRMDVDAGQASDQPAISADQPPPPRPRAFGRELVEPISQIRKCGDSLRGRRPLGLQLRIALDRSAADRAAADRRRGPIDAGFTAGCASGLDASRKSGIRSRPLGPSRLS